VLFAGTLGIGGLLVWLRVMKRENQGLCNGREQQREAEKHGRRERENGEKEKGGPSNGNKLGPTKKLSPDLNPVWIQKQVKG
jgi:hypothetical protein